MQFPSDVRGFGRTSEQERQFEDGHLGKTIDQVRGIRPVPGAVLEAGDDAGVVGEQQLDEPGGDGNAGELRKVVEEHAQVVVGELRARDVQPLVLLQDTGFFKLYELRAAF